MEDQAYISPLQAIAFEHSGQSIALNKGELIRIERSYKYTVQEALALFAAASLRVVDSWVDGEQTNSYHMYLLEKPLFSFPSTVALTEKGINPFGLATLEDWDALWKSWDCVVSYSHCSNDQAIVG